MNKGKIFELELCNKINGKFYDELDNNLKHIIKILFKTIEINKTFKAFQFLPGRKPDIVISQNNISKYISLKTGASETIHQEEILTFIKFLKTFGVKKETLRTILLFHFGDGTLNGTGKIRYPYIKVYTSLLNDIKAANIDLNSNKELVKAATNRFLFCGRDATEQQVDAIYHGSLEYGIIVTKNQINQHILKKNYDILNNLHIGPFLIYPKARYAGKEIVDNESRYKITVKWPNIQSDLTYISTRYNY